MNLADIHKAKNDLLSTTYKLRMLRESLKHPDDLLMSEEENRGLVEEAIDNIDEAVHFLDYAAELMESVHGA